jgi:NADP-dependent 3-hydroxy acid dehydrogenase YdfG
LQKERIGELKQKGETNMNSLKDKVAVSTDAMYVILGASGNTGAIIVDSLLSKGKKVRVVGRDEGRLQRFVRKGAEAFTGDVSDAVARRAPFEPRD